MDRNTTYYKSNASGAIRNKYGQISEEAEEIVKGYTAAVENYGNFFGENIFIASGGVGDSCTFFTRASNWSNEKYLLTENSPFERLLV